MSPVSNFTISCVCDPIELINPEPQFPHDVWNEDDYQLPDGGEDEGEITQESTRHNN